MSHTIGQIIKDGAIVGYYEYDGTTDYVIPKIFKTPAEVVASWRTWPIAECTCAKASEDVIIYTSYGAGYYWPGTACLACGVIIDGRISNDSIEGHPLGHWNWPFDGDGVMLPEDVSRDDEPRLKNKIP